MRALALSSSWVFVAISVAGCATSQPALKQPASALPATSERANAPGTLAPPSLTLTSLTADDNSLGSFVLHAAGTLANGSSGKELTWSVNNELGPLGSGTAPLEQSADGSFNLTLPVSLAKEWTHLYRYQKAEFVEITLDATVGAATASRTLHLPSPRIPMFSVPFVEANLQSAGSIALAFLIAVDNRNGYPLKITSIDYSCYLGGKLVTEAQMLVSTKLPASSHTEYTVNQHANEENLGKEIRAMAKQSTLTWSFEGTVHFTDLDVPFSLSGKVKLDKG